MKNLINFERNSANLPNSKANFWVNWTTNLKALFTLPKWFKIFLIVLSVVAVAGVIGSFALMSWADDKIETANLTFNGIDKGNKEVKANENAYSARVHFKRLDVLLRSKVIAYIDIKSISWVSQVDESAVRAIKSQNRYIKFISTQNLQALNTQNLGDVQFKMDFSPLIKTIVRYFVWIVVFAVGGYIFWNSFNIYSFQITPTPITQKDYVFLCFAFTLCAGICAFTFWLGFPGFHIIGDTYNSIALIKNNAHPVFIAYVLQGLYFIFGKNLYYLFLFNIVPFYAGIFFLIAGFYLRCKNPFAILLIFPTFIGNIYFQNFIQYHSFALPMMLFCIYSLILFLILVPLKRTKILWILLFVLMFFAILWRHNAIFSVFPVFFIICYLFLQNRGLDSVKFTKTYAKFIVLSAFLCLFIVIFVPKLLQTSQSHPANHPFLHQIAGACVPADDASCFKDEWYYPHKSFNDVKALYAKYPLNADPFNVTWGYDNERPFKPEKLNGLQSQWLKSIAKYPSNFIAHESRFFKAMWWQNPAWIFDVKKMQEKATHEWYISVANDFKESQRSITFTPLQEQIYSFLYNHKILLNHIWGVGVGFIILIISSVILWRRRKKIFVDNACQNNMLLVFCFSVSFASFWSAFFIVAFSPVPETRYMSPILPMSIIALVGFIAFILDCLSRKKGM